MTTDITRQQFLQALRDHPEWREEVRLQVLGEELMRLPVAFQAFVVQQEKFNDEMREFREETLRRFEIIDKRFEAMDRRFDNIDTRLDRMEHDGSWLKNAATEADAERGAFAICLAADCEIERVLDRAEITAMAQLLDEADITPGNRASFAAADMVILANRNGETVYLAVEVSYTAALRDLTRAQRNARYLADHTGLPTIPVVAGVRRDHALQDAIDQGEIAWFELDEP